MAKSNDVGGNAAVEFVTFEGSSRTAAGTLAEAAAGAWRALERNGATNVLVFNTRTGHVMDLDLRGTEAETIARYTPSAAPAPTRGRPRLGVVAREVTLLPRHWEWLASQPGGASVTLRKLVETARKADSEAGLARARSEAVYRFMSATAGDFPGFEDAARALFAGDWTGLREQIGHWPKDIQHQVLLLGENEKTRA
jgi:hypothetical protein